MGQKKFWSKKFWLSKKDWVIKFLGLKELSLKWYGSGKNRSEESVKSEKYFWSTKILGSKEILGPNKFLAPKNVGPKKCYEKS